MKRIWTALLASMLILILCIGGASAETALVLPRNTKIIEEEAFAGLKNIYEVILPEGVTQIGVRAFADSSVTKINLPDSLKFISEDAFEDCTNNLIVTANKGTYAYEWAMRMGYCGDAPIQEILIDLRMDVYGTNRYKGTIDITTSAYQIPYTLSPKNAKNDLIWESWDPSVANVSGNGVVTPLSAGVVTIVAHSPSSGQSVQILMEITGERYTSAGLAFTRASDGKGYLVSGCEGNPQRISIPSHYNGLPVVGFVPGAFKQCVDLTDIRLEAGHTVLYMENDALYADLPEKTLLAYPGKRKDMGHYYISEGTEAVAAYAFSQCWLEYITVSDSLTSIGDCAFYGLRRQMGVYFLTDVVTQFGANLFQNQQSNGYFCAASWETPAAIYANKYGIPCGLIVDRTPEPTAVPTLAPAVTPMPELPEVDESRIVIFDQLQDMHCDYLEGHFFLYDISSLESSKVSEVRMDLRNQWRNLKYYPGVSAQTGLYGAGYTAQAAVLRAYDADGNLVGAKNISGHFTFSFEGARMLGVAGGKGTKMTVVPTEPIFIKNPGRYPIRHNTWHQWTDGDVYQYYILEMHQANHNFEFPSHINILGFFSRNSVTGRYTDNTVQLDDGYTVFGVSSSDGSRADQIDVVTIIFDRMECLLDNAQFSCYATTLQERSENLGESIYGVYQATREQMVGEHYPSDVPIGKVQVRVNGNYPSSYLSIIELDSMYYVFDEWDISSISHELIHAIDQGLGIECDELMPSAWMEGRAEYISMQVCEELDAPYTSEVYGKGRDADWSLVSEADRQDYYRFYYESANRQSAYMIGYYFYDFLIDTYGEDVGARIMKNVAQYGYDEWNYAQLMADFKKCVEAATEEGVFQRFVRDVIEPSGT